MKLKVKVTHFTKGPTLCDPTLYGLLGSSVHGILQARMLEWVAIPFSKGSSQPMDWTQVSHTAGGFFTIWATYLIETHKQRIKQNEKTKEYVPKEQDEAPEEDLSKL